LTRRSSIAWRSPRCVVCAACRLAVSVRLWPTPKSLQRCWARDTYIDSSPSVRL